MNVGITVQITSLPLFLATHGLGRDCCLTYNPFKFSSRPAETTPQSPGGRFFTILLLTISILHTVPLSYGERRVLRYQVCIRVSTAARKPARELCDRAGDSSDPHMRPRPDRWKSWHKIHVDGTLAVAVSPPWHSRHEAKGGNSTSPLLSDVVAL